MKPGSWKAFHRSLGLVICLPILLQGITGIFLTLHHENGPGIPLLANPPPENFDPAKRTADLFKKMAEEIAGKKLDGLRPDALFFPENPSEAIHLRAFQGKTPLHFYFHPQTLERIPFEEKSDAPFDWEKSMLQLHRGSWWGPEGGLYGRILMSLCAALWLALWASGVVMAMNQKSNRSLAFKVHGGVGAVLGIAFCWMAATGTLLNFSKTYLSAFDPPPRVQIEKKNPVGITWDAAPIPEWIQTALLERAQAGHSGEALQPSQIRSLHFPKPPDATFLVYFKDNARVYFNFETGKHLKTQTPQTQWILSLFGLHTLESLGRLKTLCLLIIANGILLVTLLGLLLALKPRSAISLRR